MIYLYLNLPSIGATLVILAKYMIR